MKHLSILSILFAFLFTVSLSSSVFCSSSKQTVKNRFFWRKNKLKVRNFKKPARSTSPKKKSLEKQATTLSLNINQNKLLQNVFKHIEEMLGTEKCSVVHVGLCQKNYKIFIGFQINALVEGWRESVSGYFRRRTFPKGEKFFIKNDKSSVFLTLNNGYTLLSCPQ